MSAERTGPAWKHGWLSGMLTTDGVRVNAMTMDGALCDKMPDLTDAATRGCLLELIRRARPDHIVYVEPSLTEWIRDTSPVHREVMFNGGWRVVAFPRQGRHTLTVFHGGGIDEAQALVAALDAIDDDKHDTEGWYDVDMEVWRRRIEREGGAE